MAFGWALAYALGYEHNRIRLTPIRKRLLINMHHISIYVIEYVFVYLSHEF